MDIIGNWGYGVEIPQRYFTYQQINALIHRCGLQIVLELKDIELYDHLPLLKRVTNKKYQIVLLLKHE